MNLRRLFDFSLYPKTYQFGQHFFSRRRSQKLDLVVLKDVWCMTVFQNISEKVAIKYLDPYETLCLVKNIY